MLALLLKASYESFHEHTNFFKELGVHAGMRTKVDTGRLGT